MTKVLFSVVLLMAALCAAATDNDPAIDSLRQELSRTSNAADSIRILYHILDAQSRKGQILTCEQLYRTAIASGDEATALDALRHLANMYTRNDSMQAVIEQRVHEIPGTSDDKKETEVFTYLCRINTISESKNDDQIRNRLNKLLKKYATASHDDLYQHIETLFTICILLGHSTRGELLNNYLDKLGALIDQLPNKLSPLRSKYFTKKAIISTLNNNHASAVQADKRLLEIIRNLEISYNEKGRHKRGYERYYYNIYRRMLSNYTALSPNEVQRIYSEVKKLVAKGGDVAMDYERNPRPDIYYLLATNRYNEAIPLLKKAVTDPANAPIRMSLLRELKRAAEHTGDSETLLHTVIDYNQCLEDYIEMKSLERLRELQILYNVSDLKIENSKLEQDMREREILSHKRLVTYGLIALAGLTVLLIVLMAKNKRIKQMVKEANANNQKLLNERERLKLTQNDLIKARDRAHAADRQKMEFINNISHEVKEPVNAIVGYSQLIVDSVDDERRQYLERYSNIVTLNAELLLKLVNDVLDASSLENGGMKVEPKIISMQSVASMAEASIVGKLNPGVKFITKCADSEEINFKSDPQRVEQVLINLLSNAAKFTQHGTIELSWGHNKATGKVWFAVTDTGPGIPEGKEEIIFRRFEKLSNYTQGTGLGLHICRLIAKVLGGEVTLDSSYTNGSRFVLTLPRNL